jgi:hypothetical protein
VDHVHDLDLLAPFRDRRGLLRVGVEFFLWCLVAFEEVGFLDGQAACGDAGKASPALRGWWSFDLL